MIYKEFYSELGKLLYAVADIDGVITPKEKRALYDMVRSELVPGEKKHDNFGTDTAYYTDFEFDFMDEQIAEPETAFNSFIDFVEDHHTAFDQHMLDVCVHLAKELAKAYYGTNKKEKELIKKLQKNLKRIKIGKATVQKQIYK